MKPLKLYLTEANNLDSTSLDNLLNNLDKFVKLCKTNTNADKLFSQYADYMSTNYTDDESKYKTNFSINASEIERAFISGCEQTIADIDDYKDDMYGDLDNAFADFYNQLCDNIIDNLNGKTQEYIDEPSIFRDLFSELWSKFKLPPTNF